jgi:hypothetical protein
VPAYDTLVEPFAGSAGYSHSLRYSHLNISICELDPVLAEVWRYLTVVKPSKIRAIPDVRHDGSVDDLKVCVVFVITAKSADIG